VTRDDARDLGLASVAAILAFAVYLRTLAPTITGEDSGELVTAAWTLGVPHAPGFPLYCLLAHAWSRALAAGEVAWRVNAFSAACASAAVGFVCLAARRLGVRRSAALAAALLLAWSERLWQSALVAEVYALDACLLAAVLWLLLRWRESGRPADLRWAAAGYGLALGNHLPLALLVGPALVGFGLWLGGRRLWQGGEPVKLAAAGLAPLAVYAYLPWAARRRPPLNLGDPSSWERFVAHVTRARFRELESANAGSPADAIAFVADFVEQWAEQLTPWIGLPLFAAGLWGLRGRRPVAALLLGVIALDSLLLTALRRPYPHAESFMLMRAYFLPAYVASALVVACGLERIAVACAGWRPRAGVVAATAALLLPAVVLLAGFGERDLRGYALFRDVNRAVLESLAPEAVYLPGPDHRSFPAVYLQAVLGLRPDVKIVLSGQRESAEAFAGGPRPLYLSRRVDIARPERFRFASTGLAYRVEPREGSAAPIATANPGVLERLPDRPARDPVERLLRSELYRLEAERLLDRGEPGSAAKARAAFGRAIEYAWDSRAGLNNLAGILAQRGRLEPALRCARRALEIEPGYALARDNLVRLLERAGRHEEAASLRAQPRRR
jgi:hypothetical protein